MVTRLCASMGREDTALDLCGLGIAAPEGGGKAAEEGPEAARDSAQKALAALEAVDDVAIAVEPAPGTCCQGAACIGTPSKTEFWQVLTLLGCHFCRARDNVLKILILKGMQVDALMNQVYCK